MKKLHILIPSLIATASMPLVGLVGCKKGNNEEDDYTVIDVDIDYGSTVGRTTPGLKSEPFTIEAGKKYRANIDISKSACTETTEYALFKIETVDTANEHNESAIIPFVVFSYKVDGRSIFSAPYWIAELTDLYWFSSLILYATLSQKLSKTSHITIDLGGPTTTPADQVSMVLSNNMVF